MKASNKKRNFGNQNVKNTPLSLYESGDSTGDISLEEVFKGNDNILAQSNITLEKIIDLILRGGFPKVVNMPLEEAKVFMNGYYESLINEIIKNFDGVKRKPNKVDSFLKSYSRYISTSEMYSKIRKEMDEKISKVTFRDYKTTLEKLKIINNVESWNVPLRSKKSIRKSDKKMLIDPSIATSALCLSKEKIIKDFNFFGYLFEAMCIRDLRIYVESLDGKIYHYFEQKNNPNDKEFEIDVILELRDGRWGAVEVKLGADQVNEAASKLFELKSKIDTNKKGEPSFLMVLYGGKASYKREDGVLVVSIGSLKN